MFPTSNMRIVKYILNAGSFFGCAPCGDGDHGAIEDGRCLCCGWEPTFKVGSVIS